MLISNVTSINLKKEKPLFLSVLQRKGGILKELLGAGPELKVTPPPGSAAASPLFQAVLMGSPPDPSHLWRFLERFAVEAAYSSALNDLIVG